MYLPVIASARRVRKFRLGPFLATLVTDCQMPATNQPIIRYKHILFLSALHDPVFKPFFAVAAERSSMLEEMALSGEGYSKDAHFLGVFPGEGHMNFGMSDEWADLDKFSARALEIASQHLKISDTPQEIPLTDAEQDPFDPYAAYRAPQPPPRPQIRLGSFFARLTEPKKLDD
jgi:hypothetical protein